MTLAVTASTAQNAVRRDIPLTTGMGASARHVARPRTLAMTIARVVKHARGADFASIITHGQVASAPNAEPKVLRSKPFMRGTDVHARSAGR